MTAHFHRAPCSTTFRCQSGRQPAQYFASIFETAHLQRVQLATTFSSSAKMALYLGVCNDFSDRALSSGTFFDDVCAADRDGSLLGNLRRFMRSCTFIGAVSRRRFRRRSRRHSAQEFATIFEILHFHRIRSPTTLSSSATKAHRLEICNDFQGCALSPGPFLVTLSHWGIARVTGRPEM